MFRLKLFYAKTKADIREIIKFRSVLRHLIFPRPFVLNYKKKKLYALK